MGCLSGCTLLGYGEGFHQPPAAWEKGDGSRRVTGCKGQVEVCVRQVTKHQSAPIGTMQRFSCRQSVNEIRTITLSLYDYHHCSPIALLSPIHPPISSPSPTSAPLPFPHLPSPPATSSPPTSAPPASLAPVPAPALAFSSTAPSPCHDQHRVNATLHSGQDSEEGKGSLLGHTERQEKHKYPTKVISLCVEGEGTEESCCRHSGSHWLLHTYRIHSQTLGCT